MSLAPVVTGLSPIEGPPGTKVIIRGENLGQLPNDLIGLTICGCDCLLSAEWKSPNKIIARSGPGKGRGDIIVTTRRGGVGTCTVQFRGYHETIGLMKESAVWVEETPLLFIWGRRSMSPSSYQHEDPLGLSVEGNEKKFPEDDLLELFPFECGDIASENFSAAWFLLENHHATTFNDLKAGLSFLRRKVESQKEDQLTFLKANVGSVIDQVDTLKSLRENFEEDEISNNLEPTLKLEKAIKEAMHEANKLFEDVLTRRDRADATRSALNVLTRFKFLFCLPCAIERNIKRGDYEIVINDYARVKNLFKKTDIGVFRKALTEIEKRVVGLKAMLHTKLRQMPVSIEEQKRIIRYLVNLESEDEPAWEAITSHFQYISQKIKNCYEEHKSADALVEDSSNAKNYALSKFSKNISNLDSQYLAPPCVLFVEELCEIMSTSFPDLWKLGQAYFTEELHVKVEPGRSTAFKDKSLSTILTFCKTVRSAVIPHTLDKISDRQQYGSWPSQEIEVIAPWLPLCLHSVRSTYSVFIKLDLPGDALDLLSKLILDLRLHCMTVLFKQAVEHIKALEKKETWKIEFSSNHAGTTQLPLKFEQIVHDIIQQIRESILVNEQRENNLFETAAAKHLFEQQVNVLLQSYCTTLENLALHNKNTDGNHHPISQLIGSPVLYRISENLNAVPVWEQKLLTTLSNYNYTKNVILPRISELFAKNGYPSVIIPIENTKSLLLALDKSIMETYLEQKSDPLVGTIEPSMYLGRFDWDTNIKPTSVRPYAKECINNLIGVYAEVHKVSPNLVKKILMEVIEIVAEELSRLMSCVKRFSHWGMLQARTDILALQETLQNYVTPKAKLFFDEALEAIPPIKNEELKIVEDILKQFRVRMKLQILCFH